MTLCAISCSCGIQQLHDTSQKYSYRCAILSLINVVLNLQYLESDWMQPHPVTSTICCMRGHQGLGVWLEILTPSHDIYF